MEDVTINTNPRTENGCIPSIKKTCLTMEFEPHNCQVIVDRMIKLDPNIEIKRNGTLLSKSEIDKFIENTSE